ncbi:ATP-binding cassette domain-containing protein [Streptomyces sp. NPDC029674]|uniref:ABC transporter ATP-binding protein n=1 Tax=Streptomyces sp. NPDC029674 TaxID=3365297 RepID=UPI00384FFFD6
MIAGPESITSGRLLLDQQPADDLPAGERDVAMVLQNFALHPAMTAAENIAFPLTARGDDQHTTTQAVNAVADLLGIRSLLTRTAAQLSGGERQRVAMDRAVIRRPSVFLMDEPLSSLDARLRVRLRTEIPLVVRRTGATTVYVTQGHAEAMALGDRVAVLRDGALQQIGTPNELCELPANAFVDTPHINTTPTPYERPLTALVHHVEYQGHEDLLHVTVGARPTDVPRPEAAPDEPQTTNSLARALHSTIGGLRRALPRRPVPASPPRLFCPSTTGPANSSCAPGKKPTTNAVTAYSSSSTSGP